MNETVKDVSTAWTDVLEFVFVIALLSLWNAAAAEQHRHADAHAVAKMNMLKASLHAQGDIAVHGHERLRALAHNAASHVNGFIPVTFIDTRPSMGGGSDRPPLNDAAEVGALIRNQEFDKALAVATRMTQSSPGDPSGFNFQGAAYLGKKDTANARKSFEKALKLNPDDAIALTNLGQIDILQKDTVAARKRFQAVLSKTPNDVPAMLGMAQLEILKGDSKAMFTWFEKAKAARPEAVDPRLNIAAYHMRRSNFKQAIQELTEAKRVIPGNADIIDLLGQAQLADGQSKSAIATFKDLVAARPDAPLAYYRLATAQAGNNDFAGAAQSLKKALQIKPEFVSATVLLAELETREKRYSEALKLAKQLQSMQEAAPIGLVLEGDILMAQQRYADATKAYESAFAKNPTGPMMVKLHRAQTGSGKLTDADATLERWLRNHPDDLAALQFAAAENVRKGQNKLAIAQYEQIVRKDATNQLALNNLAGLYHQAGHPKALQTAEAAYKLNPESPVIADTLGWLLIEQGNTTRGLQLLKSALARAPKNPEIRYHLAAAQAKTGDKINARKELEALLASEQAFPDRAAAQALLTQL